jgi:hypothetical protein
LFKGNDFLFKSQEDERELKKERDPPRKRVMQLVIITENKIESEAL